VQHLVDHVRGEPVGAPTLGCGGEVHIGARIAGYAAAGAAVVAGSAVRGVG
jgi:hypothetical protein